MVKLSIKLWHGILLISDLPFQISIIYYLACQYYQLSNSKIKQIGKVPMLMLQSANK